MLSVPAEQGVSHESGVTAVAIRVGVNGDEAMMKPDRDLNEVHADVVIVPVESVVEHVAEFDADLVWLDPDIGDPLSVLTRPPPNSSEHALVESVGERGGEQGVDGGQVSGRKEPFRGVEDAVLLGGV